MIETLAGPRPETVPAGTPAATFGQPCVEAPLYALARQALPMLLNPWAHGQAERRRVAEALADAIGTELIGSAEPYGEPEPPHADADAPPEYEPGCELEEGGPWEE